MPTTERVPASPFPALRLERASQAIGRIAAAALPTRGLRGEIDRVTPVGLRSSLGRAAKSPGCRGGPSPHRPRGLPGSAGPDGA